MATSKTKKASRPAATKSSPASKAVPAKLSPEEKLAQSTIKLLDQAAEVLKKGLTTGASESAKAREAAKKKAHTLLGKAHAILGKGLDEGYALATKTLKKLP